MGVGTVGSGVFRVLRKNENVISHRDGVEFFVKKILVGNINKKREISFAKDVLTDDFKDILGDSEITLVGEFLGGIHPALEYVEALLKAGKTVVTANKELLANHWPRLEQAARSSGRRALLRSCGRRRDSYNQNHKQFPPSKQNKHADGDYKRYDELYIDKNVG